jgi:HSP20 family protein
MTSRRHSIHSLWRDFDKLLADMERRFNEMMQRLEPETSLSIPKFPGRVLPALRGEFSMDVREQEGGVLVIADLPGAQKEDIHVSLLDSRTLEILAKREKRTEETGEGGFYMRERLSGSLRRRITLPADVTDTGAHALFENGVLEIHLPKKGLPAEKQIPIVE